MDPSTPDFAHSPGSGSMRREKAITLARFIWDRGISRTELQAFSEEQRRKLARAAGVNPPSTHETWDLVDDLIKLKNEWAQAHPGHPSALPGKLDEKIMWVKPPIKPWT